MIRIIYLTLILSCLVFSCGKKGDPVYKQSNEKIKLQNTFINKI